MATQFKTTVFGNNERREANLVTGALPAVLAPADLREGLPQETLISGDTYNVIKLPGGIVVSNAYVVVDDAMDGSIVVAVAIGTGTPVPIVAAADCNTVGVTLHADWLETLITDDTYVTMIPTVTTPATQGSVKVVIEYTDYNRSTKSFIS